MKGLIGFAIGAAREVDPARPDDYGLGVTCAVAVTEGESKPRIWWEYSIADDTPLPKMSAEKLQYILMWLNQMELDDYRIVTLGGLGFDFRVMAAESGMTLLAKHLAYKHTDLHFEMLVKHGCLPATDDLKVAHLWQTDHEKVLASVKSTARAALSLAEGIQRDGQISWTGKNGKTTQVTLPGLLTVGECMKLTDPDQMMGWLYAPREEIAA